MATTLSKISDMTSRCHVIIRRNPSVAVALSILNSQGCGPYNHVVHIDSCELTDEDAWPMLDATDLKRHRDHCLSLLIAHTRQQWAISSRRSEGTEYTTKSSTNGFATVMSLMTANYVF